MRAVNQMSALRSIFAKTSRPVAGATRQFCFAAGQRYAHATVEGQAHHYYYHRPRSGRFLLLSSQAQVQQLCTCITAIARTMGTIVAHGLAIRKITKAVRPRFKQQTSMPSLHD